MKRSVLSILVLSVLLGIRPSFAEEPTREQTIKFIESKCDIRFEDSGNRSDYRVQDVTIKDCIITTTEKQPKYGKVYTQEIALKELDPTRIEIIQRGEDRGYEAGLIYIKVFNDRHLVKGNKSRAFELSLLTRPGDHTLKAAKAMAHLIKLCGGKGEMF